MAEMTFRLISYGESYSVENIISYEWSRDTDAACDAVRLNFEGDNPISEAQRLEAYLDKELVFSGYVDFQSRSVDKNGIREFVYARSSACLLVDNEAVPMSYKSPCVSSLFFKNAMPFGFKNGLENHSTSAEYTVQKGTSCYGVINSFVRAFEEKSVVVSPKGVLYIPRGEVVYHIDPETVIFEKRSVNRGKAICRIDYKTDGSYVHHRKSISLEEKGINRSRQINMSALPEWQRTMAMSNKLKRAAQDYYNAEITVCDIVAAELYSPVALDGYEGYYIHALDTVFTPNGVQTKISLRKGLKLKEIDYVA